MSHLKTPFVLIPIFLNVILLVGIPYFGAKPPMISLFPILALAIAWPWVVVRSSASSSTRPFSWRESHARRPPTRR